jgi:nitric oxide reductase large subunit
VTINKAMIIEVMPASLIVVVTIEFVVRAAGRKYQKKMRLVHTITCAVMAYSLEVFTWPFCASVFRRSHQ